MANNKSSHVETVQSVCPQCLSKIPADIIVKDGKVFMSKVCSQHGEFLSLVEEDAEYYLSRNNYDKPPTESTIQTKVNKGCPFDCGLCPVHKQHSCIGLIEVTNNCNLNCPVCYASAGEGEYLDLKTIEKMMDFYQEAEKGKAEILQLSGGEPTLHPEIIDIIKLARTKKFKYVMLNTNGIRIADDIEFVQQLSQFVGGFEIYFQFDGFERSIHSFFRGKDVLDKKLKAIRNMVEYKIPVTIVATVERGINDDQLGKIVQFALDTPFVRGVNFQPVTYFGRGEVGDMTKRVTITDILNRIEKQTVSSIRKSDFIPLPCNVDKISVNYMYKDKNGFIPVARNIKVKNYLPAIKNSLAFDVEDVLNQTADGLCDGGFCDCMSFLKDFITLNKIKSGLKDQEKRIDYVNQNTFRITVTSFMDVYNFDCKSVKKECVHVITPDLKRIPFSTFNMIYREQYAKESADTAK
ncbi:MAG: radical SAM protein [Candidatus Omnitrophica bacterium]|nr:radical SAM protein [Candidatus Omnitrophota bacterium]MBU1995633.1 radical SAM protein [Candidatus Omnitrophota bacterium]